MKLLGKILALLLVGLGLLSAIAVFYETQVSIPQTPPESNPHADYLKRNSLSIVGLLPDGKFEDADSTLYLQDDTLEKVYHRQQLALRRFSDEKLISDSEYNHQLDTFVICYSQAFVYQAHTLFRERIWPNNDRSFLTKRVSELCALEDNDNNNVLDKYSKLQSQVNAITTSCGDYVKASHLLSQERYTTLSSAKNNIQETVNLLNKGSLNLNTSIIDELRDYPQKIGDSHFQLIKDLADGIANWRNNTLSTTLSRYERLMSETDAYSSDGKIYRGEHPYSVSQLRNTAGRDKNEAVENLSTLYVDGYASTVTRNINSNSGYLTFSIRTNYPGGYSLQDTNSSWFSIESESSSSIIVSYDNNASYNEREDYFTVTAGKRSIRVNLIQSGAPNYGSVDRGYVSANSYSDWNSQQTVGTFVTVSVTGDGFCDLDLIITDGNGNRLGKDESPSTNASVRFYAAYSGTFYIRVKNCSDRGCSYTLRVR